VAVRCEDEAMAAERTFGLDRVDNSVTVSFNITVLPLSQNPTPLAPLLKISPPVGVQLKFYRPAATVDAASLGT
jgi:hypothetical protein